MVAIVTGAGLGLAGTSAAELGAGGQLELGTGAAGRGTTVNAKTGNLVIQSADELLAGRGPDIELVRTYNSGATFDFDNGDGWQLSLYRQLRGLTGTVNTAGSTITRIGADGAQLIYTYDANRGGYVSTEGGGAYDILTYSSTTATWKWSDGETKVTETYAATSSYGQWRITSLSDANGNALSYTYDSAGRISEITDANGEATRLIYDDVTSLLTSIAVVTGSVTTTRVRYTYDLQRRLTAVATDLTPSDGSIADGKTYTTRYTYDGSSTLITSIANSDGTTVSFTYDGSGRVSTLKDGIGQATTITYGSNSTTVTDPLGQSSVITYDTAGHLVRLQGPASSGQDVSYTYNAKGDLTQLADSRGNVVSSTYDSHGNLLSQQDSAGNRVVRSYDAADQLVAESVYAVPDPDGSGAATASSPLTTYYLRDAVGRVRFTVSPEGRVTEFQYNGYGQPVVQLDYAAATYTVGASAPTMAMLSAWSLAQDLTRVQRTDMTYDARGQVASVTRYVQTNSLGIGLVNGAESTTRYVYDSAGRLLQQIDPRGVATGAASDYVTSYAYDGLGRTISITQTDSAGTTSRQTLTTFRDSLQQVEVSFANGLTRLSTFDARGVVTSEVEQSGATVLSTKKYQYDQEGRLRILTDANGGKTYFLYDSAGRKIGEIDPAGSLTQWSYNAAGEVIRTQRYATAVTTNLVALFAPNGSGIVPNVLIEAVRPQTSNADPVTRFVYDTSGRLRFTIDARGDVTEIRYDGAGREISRIAYTNGLNNAAGLDSLGREARPSDIQLLVATPSSSQIGLKIDSANDRPTRYFYDDDGKLEGTLDGEGCLTQFQYDAVGQLSHTVRYGTATAVELRATGTLASLIASANAAPSKNIDTFAYYNGLGQLVGELDGAGYYTAYQYDRAGNRTTTTRYANSLVGSAVVSIAPSLCLSIPGTLPTGGYILLSAKDQATQISWTAFNQIESQTSENGSLTRYTYDAQGNLSAILQGVGTPDDRTRLYRYDLQGRLTQELSARGAEVLDALGTNPTAEQIEAVWMAYGTTYVYDAGGRRIRSTDSNGNVTLFFYDADNRLTYTVRRVRNPTDGNQWVGEASGRLYDVLGQLVADIGYSTRIGASAFSTLTGGSDTQIKAAGILVTDSGNDRRTDYTYALDGQLSRSAVRLSGTETAVTELSYNAFGELASRQTGQDATHIRREEFIYDRRGLLTQDNADIAWGSNSGATGKVTSIVYDVFGRAERSIDGNGIVYTTQYDKLGRQISVVTDAGGLALLRATTYDAFDRVLTQSDAQGKITTSAYAVDTASGRTTLTVTSPEGLVTKTVTDRFGQTLALVDAQGNETRYSYDADGNLLTVKHWDKANNTETPLSVSSYDATGNRLTTQDANGTTVQYAYDAAGRILTRTVDPSGLGLVTRTTYDALGRAVSVTDPSGTVTRTTYDAAGRAVQVAVDPEGLNLRTRYTYDFAGNMVTVVEGEGTSAARTTQYAYDSLGRRTRTVIDPLGLALTSTYAYDQNGNLVTKVDGAGTATARTTRYAYDGADRLVYSVDALGTVTQNTYDRTGRVVVKAVYANAISLTGLATAANASVIASRISADTARDRVTRYAYDGDGRVRFTTDALGAVTETRYDVAGRVVREISYANRIVSFPDSGLAPVVATSADDQVTVFSYDSQGRLTSRTEGYGTTLTRTETWGYDSVGNAIRHTDFRGNTEWFAYDAAGRQIRHIDQGGYVSTTAWNADGTKAGETHFIAAVALPSTPDDAWGAAGHAATPAITADDRILRYDYDAAKRLTKVTDAQGYTQTYGYDALSNKISYTDQRGNTWNYAYDAAGRLTDETSPQVNVTMVSESLVSSQATVRLVTHLAYDVLGNVTARTEAYGRPEARTTSYQYDVVGHQIKTIYPPVGVYAGDDLTTNGTSGTVARTEQTITPMVTVTYNALGQAVVNQDAAGNFSYKVYDTLGQILYEVDAEHYLTAYTYDAYGNVLTVTRYATALALPFARATALSASEVQGLIRTDIADRTLTNKYDVLNQLQTVTEPAVDSYDPGAATGSQTFNAGRVTEKTYNAAGQLVLQRVLANPLSETWASTYFYYDTRGNKTAQVDALGYLTTWNYDAAGNITTQVEYAQALVAGSWSIAGYGVPTVTTHVTAPDSPIGYDRVTTYTYDRNNRMRSETRVDVEYATTSGALGVATVFGNLTTLYAYDGIGNLVAVTDATGATSHLYYDALGRKTAVTAPERTQEGIAGTVNMPTVNSVSHRVETTSLVSATATTSTDGLGQTTTTWSGTNTIKLAWDSVADYGPDQIHVQVEYLTLPSNGSPSKTCYKDGYFNNDEAANGVAFNWTGVGISTVSRIRVWKVIDGQETLVRDSAAVQGSNSLTFAKSEPRDTTVQFFYRTKGSSGAWIQGSLNTDGNFYSVSTSALAADQYDYRITYTRTGETQAYATGTGTFQVISGSGTGDNVVGFFARPELTQIQIRNSWSSDPMTWSGSSTSISLAWGPLDEWGNGDVLVRIDYTNKTRYGSTGAYKEMTFSAGTARTGAKLEWTDSSVADKTLKRVQVWKKINGQYVQVMDRTATGKGAPQYVIAGNTTGVTGVDIAGVGVRSVTTLGGGVYAVDLSDLSRGTYTYTLVGSSTQSGSFDITDSGTAGAAGIQEVKIGGDRLLAAYNLPADTVQATLQYRALGDTGPYFVKTLSLNNGAWSVGYEEMLTGRYEYVMMLESGTGAESSVTGFLDIRRGAMSLTTVTLANTVDATVTPLSEFRLDAYGNTVEQIDYAKGAVLTANNYAVAGLSALADKHSFYFFNSHGHVIRSVDAEGASKYNSYDVLGHVAKEWQPVADNDGLLQNAVRTYQYDRLGYQVACIESTYQGTRALPAGSSLAASTTQLTKATSRLSYTINTKSSTTGDDLYTGTNKITLSWSDLSSLGSGDVRVALDYNTANKASAGYREFVVASATAATGAVVSWAEAGEYMGGLSEITRVRVYKKNTAGQWVLIHDRSTSSTTPYGNELFFAKPQAGIQATFFYRTADGTWAAAKVDDMGSYFRVDPASLNVRGNTPYQYEILYTRAGEANPSSHATGTVTLTTGTPSDTTTMVGLIGTTVTINTQGSTASVYTPTAPSAVGFVRMQTGYNAFGEIVKKGINDGWQESYSYDRAGRLWRSTGEDGITRVYRYDGLGNLTAEIESQQTGLLSGLAGPSAVAGLPAGSVQRTETQYDLLGHAVVRRNAAFTNDGSGTQTVPEIRQTLDRWGNVLAVTDPRNATWVTVNCYDSGNRLIQQTLPEVQITGVDGVTTLQTPKVRAYYDANGRMVAKTDANGNTNTFRYDAAGQVVREYHADGGLVRYQYDLFGRKIRQVDAIGNAVDYVYDRVDQLIRQKHASGDDVYAYDALGNRVKETNALGETVSYWYDMDGRVVRMRQPLGQDTVYAYDAQGRKTSETNALGDTARWTYDYGGHVLTHTDLGGAVITYTYNGIGGELTKTSTRGEKIVTTYYENGAIKSVRDEGASVVALQSSSGGVITGNSYVKTAAAGWNVGPYSLDSLNGQVFVSATAGQTNMKGVFGLTDVAPSGSNSYGSLDYAWYTDVDGVLRIYESGNDLGSFGTYSATDVLSISYDGTKIAYMKNGVVMRLVSTTAGQTFYFDSSLYTTGYRLNNIQFTHFDPKLGNEVQYAYDAAGNRTLERYSRPLISYANLTTGAVAGATVWDTTISYDALGRVTQINEDNPDHAQYRYRTTYKYDANGNRREVQATYYDKNKVQQTSDSWYKYDAMDRMTLSQGYLVNGEIDLEEDLPSRLVTNGIAVNGNTLTKTSVSISSGTAYSNTGATGSAYVSATIGQVNKEGYFGLEADDPSANQGNVYPDYAWGVWRDGTLNIRDHGFSININSTYTVNDVLSIAYDRDTIRFLKNGVVMHTASTMPNSTFYFGAYLNQTGFILKNVQFGQFMRGAEIAYDAAGNRRSATSYDAGILATDNYTYDGDNRLLNTTHNGSTSTTRRYDAAGRMIEEVNYDTATNAVKDRRTMTYDANGRASQVTIADKDSRVTQQVRYTDYDRAGNLRSYQAQVYTTTKYTNTYTYSYAKADGYQEKRIDGTSTYFKAGATIEEYDQNGYLVAVSETFGKKKDRTFVTDQAGRILAKMEDGKRQYYFYADGQSVGTAGTLASADFDMNYTPVSESYPASVPGSYIVGEGDTLAGIAFAVYGDANLWYLIADANGLQSDADLVVGDNLTVPNRVTNLRNAYDTFKPYAPGSLIGDTTPDLPPPSPKGGGGGCGGAGIIIAVIAVVATIYTAGAAATLLSSGGTLASAATTLGVTSAATTTFGVGMAALASSTTLGLSAAIIGGAVGAIAGQLAGMALGVQKNFSWSGVAMGAIGAGVTAGIAGMANATGALSGLAGQEIHFAVGRAVLGNVVTQGVGVMVGAQDHFNWASVAAGAAAVGVSAWAGEQLKLDPRSLSDTSIRAGVASVTSAGVRELLTGRPVAWDGIAADALSAVIQSDAFGNALGNSIVEANSAPATPVTMADANTRIDSHGVTSTPESADLLGALVDVMGDAPDADLSHSVKVAAGKLLPLSDAERARQSDVNGGIGEFKKDSNGDEYLEISARRIAGTESLGSGLRAPESVFDKIAREGFPNAWPEYETGLRPLVSAAGEMVTGVGDMVSKALWAASPLSAWETMGRIADGTYLETEIARAQGLSPFNVAGKLQSGVESFITDVTSGDEIRVNYRLAQTALAVGPVIIGSVGRAAGIEGALGDGIVANTEAAAGGTSTVYRVQGGVMPNASKTLITLDANGSPIIQNGTLNISIGDASHAEYFQTLRPGGTVTSFEIPSWLDSFIQENAIPQYGYRSNPLNQGGLAPKIVDPTTPGRSYELPAPWGQWLQENAILGSGKVK